jgi:phenylalanyl-tRNA synthetase alpha chain
MLERIVALRSEALDAVRRAPDAAALEAARSRYLGPKAELPLILRTVKDLPPDQRAAVGSQGNALKREIEREIALRLEGVGDAKDLAAEEWVDATLPGARRGAGTIHPVTQMVREVEDVFLGMGFDLLDGPWVEDDRHNFGALNIPADHPARDMQDTFWLADGNLLRTHTSPVQIRAMESRPPPIRAVAIGRVFRHEEVDATHENTFHQVEGFLVDRDVNAGHMVYVLRALLGEVFGQAVDVRLRPSYFPFVEPGFEMDVKFRGRWMELLGCGLVHPKVLEAGGVDPARFSGFAFGLGIDRLVMLRHGIEDIRWLMSGDLRFLRQFRRGVDA